MNNFDHPKTFSLVVEKEYDIKDMLTYFGFVSENDSELSKNEKIENGRKSTTTYDQIPVLLGSVNDLEDLSQEYENSSSTSSNFMKDNVVFNNQYSINKETTYPDILSKNGSVGELVTVMTFENFEFKKHLHVDKLEDQAISLASTNDDLDEYCSTYSQYTFQVDSSECTSYSRSSTSEGVEEEEVLSFSNSFSDEDVDETIDEEVISFKNYQYDDDDQVVKEETLEIKTINDYDILDTVKIVSVPYTSDKLLDPDIKFQTKPVEESTDEGLDNVDFKTPIITNSKLIIIDQVLDDIQTDDAQTEELTDITDDDDISIFTDAASYLSL